MKITSNIPSIQYKTFLEIPIGTMFQYQKALEIESNYIFVKINNHTKFNAIELTTREINSFFLEGNSIFYEVTEIKIIELKEMVK